MTLQNTQTIQAVAKMTNGLPNKRITRETLVRNRARACLIMSEHTFRRRNYIESRERDMSDVFNVRTNQNITDSFKAKDCYNDIYREHKNYNYYQAQRFQLSNNKCIQVHLRSVI